MAYRAGSEEFNRSRVNPNPYSEPGYNRDTLDLMRQNQATSLSQLQQQREIQNRQTDMIRADVDSIMNNAERGYERGQRQQDRNVERQRESRRFDTEEAASRDQAALRQQQLAESKQNMENAQKQSQIMYGDRQGGSLAEQQALSQVYSQKLQGQSAALQADAQKRQNAASSRDNLAVIMKDAMSRNDQAALAAAKAQGSSMGLSPTDIQVAEATAKTQLASARETSNLTFDTSVPGQLANDKLVQLRDKIDSLSTLINEGSAYKKAAAGSKEEEAALQKLQMSLSPQDQAQLDSRISVDTSGIRTRSKVVDKLVQKTKGDVQRELRLLEAQAATSGSPRMKEQIEILKQNLAQIDALSGSKVNFMTGQPGSQGGTALINALKGQSNQQPISAPASVQMVNDQLKGQKTKGSPLRRLESR